MLEPEKNYQSPIFENNGKWYFCEDNWSGICCPFETATAANEALFEYCLIKSEENNT